MAEEQITTAQVLHALAGLTDNVRSAFNATEDLAEKTAAMSQAGTIAQPPSSSSKKTAKAPEEYNGDLEGGNTFIRELYLYLYSETFDNKKKITIALSFLSRGNAAEWCD